MFARVLGPFFVIVPITVAVRTAYMQTLFTEFKANPMWPWLFGAVLLMLGLVIIAFHQYLAQPRGGYRVATGVVFGGARGAFANRSPGLQLRRQRGLQLGCYRGDMGVFHLPSRSWALPDLRRLEAGTAHTKSHGELNQGSPARRG
jgi:hypothetical protein